MHFNCTWRDMCSQKVGLFLFIPLFWEILSCLKPKQRSINDYRGTTKQVIQTLSTFKAENDGRMNARSLRALVFVHWLIYCGSKRNSYPCSLSTINLCHEYANTRISDMSYIMNLGPKQIANFTLQAHTTSFMFASNNLYTIRCYNATFISQTINVHDNKQT